MERCPYCENMIPENSEQCPLCGGRLKSIFNVETNICPACGYNLLPGQTECPVCHLKKGISDDYKKVKKDQENLKSKRKKTSNALYNISEKIKMPSKKLRRKWQKSQNEINNFITDRIATYSKVPCPECGELVGTNQKVCPYCDTSFQIFASNFRCPNCMENISSSWTHCLHCGYDLSLGKKTISCPYCTEDIPETSKKCPYCNEEIDKDINYIVCPQCNNHIPEKNSECPVCHLDLPQINNGFTCHYCGEAIDPSWKICPFCDEEIKQTYIPATSTIQIDKPIKKDSSYKYEDLKKKEPSDKKKSTDKSKFLSPYNIILFSSIIVFITVTVILILYVTSWRSNKIVLEETQSNNIPAEQQSVEQSEPEEQVITNENPIEQNNLSQLEELRTFHNLFDTSSDTNNSLHVIFDLATSLNKNYQMNGSPVDYLRELSGSEDNAAVIDSNQSGITFKYEFMPPLKPHMMTCYSESLIESSDRRYRVFKDNGSDYSNATSVVNAYATFDSRHGYIEFISKPELIFKNYETYDEVGTSYSCRGNSFNDGRAAYRDVIWIYRLTEIDAGDDSDIKIQSNPNTRQTYIKFSNTENKTTTLKYQLYFIGNELLLSDWDRSRTIISTDATNSLQRLQAFSKYDSSKTISNVWFNEDSSIQRQNYPNQLLFDYDTLVFEYYPQGSVMNVSQLNLDWEIKKIKYYPDTYIPKIITKYDIVVACIEEERDHATDNCISREFNRPIEYEYSENGRIQKEIYYDVYGTKTNSIRYNDYGSIIEMTDFFLSPRGNNQDNFQSRTVSYTSSGTKYFLNNNREITYEQYLSADNPYFNIDDNSSINNVNLQSSSLIRSYMDSADEHIVQSGIRTNMLRNNSSNYQSGNNQEFVISSTQTGTGNVSTAIADDIRIRFIGDELTEEAITEIEYLNDEYHVINRFKFYQGNYPDNPYESTYYYYNNNDSISGILKLNSNNRVLFRAIYEYDSDENLVLYRFQHEYDDIISCSMDYNDENIMISRECRTTDNEIVTVENINPYEN